MNGRRLPGYVDLAPAAIVFAATRSERTQALIRLSSLAFTATGWDDLDRDPAEVRTRYLRELGEDYMPLVEQLARTQN